MKKIIAFYLFLLISNFLFSKNLVSYNLSLKTSGDKNIEKKYDHSSIQSSIVTVNTVSDLSNIDESLYTTAIVLGYHEKNDGGGGIFSYNSTTSGINDGGMNFNGWERNLTGSAINIKWFGAISTKSNVEAYTDPVISNIYSNITNISTVNDLIDANTDAFQKSLVEVIKRRRDHNLTGTNNHITASSILIPSGDYLVGEDLINRSRGVNTSEINTERVSGIKYYSDGRSTLTFRHSGTNKYAFINKDPLLGITFSDIDFVGFNNQCNLFYSASSGGAQDYYFERCNFRGDFNNIFTLRTYEELGEDGDNNSEWGFMKCSFGGKVNTILDITGSNTSDQFLNYWFDQTKFWIEEGTIINADKGGHFKFNNCDWSGYRPSQETYYFKLNATSSSRGVNDFRIINGRFEMKNSNARVLKSNWQHGNIEITADFGSQAPPQFAGVNMKHFEFNFQGASNTSFNSLNINFRNSIMMGHHEFNYGNNAWRGTGRVSYENCSFPYRNSLDGFIDINHNGNNNKSGIANIEIKNAIFENNANTNPYTPNDPYNTDRFGNPLYPNNYNVEIPSLNYLPSYSNRGLKKKYFQIAHPARGENPLGNQKFILNFPVESEAIITSVKWYLGKWDLTSSATVEFALTNLAGNIIISKIDPVPMWKGFHKKDEVNINVKDLTEGKLVLKDLSNNANQISNKFLCVIEYY